MANSISRRPFCRQVTITVKDVAAAIIIKNNKILIAQRAEGQKLAGKWEFPGGKIEDGETPEECLKREIKEELDIDIEVDGFFGESVYTYGTETISLIAYKARFKGGQCKLKVHSRAEWVEPHELVNYDFAPADVPFVEKLRENLL
nr:8-oxo-dGTP diphosphatase MutT [Caldicoprobacter algeriensis]